MVPRGDLQVKEKSMEELFIVEFADGESLDLIGEGFTVFATRAEAQGAIDWHSEEVTMEIVRFVREPDRLTLPD